jgi:hypothetical protein
MGFLTALRLLEIKYGGQNNMERALYEKLRNLGLLSLKDLDTIVEAKITIWSLVRLYAADNRDPSKLDEIVFTCMSLDNRAYTDYKNYRVSKGKDNDTHDSFTAWVESLERDDMRKRGQQNVSMGRVLDRQNANPVMTTKNTLMDSKSNETSGLSDPEDIVLTTRQQECVNCEKIGHTMPNCFEFHDLDIDARWKRVEERQVCDCCLKKGHKKDVCRSREKGRAVCLICRDDHNTLLHRDRGQAPPIATTKLTPAQAEQAKINRKEINDTIDRLVKQQLEKASMVTVEYQDHDKCFTTNKLRKYPTTSGKYNSGHCQSWSQPLQT